MKYTTFRNLVAAGALALAGLGVWRCSTCAEERRPEEDPAFAGRMAQVQPAPLSASAPLAAAGDPVPASVAEQLRAKLGTSADSDKIKDMTGGSGVKVNVYNEGGTWARAKVDHDRDEKWDEKWHLDGEVVVRQIAPLDDESYTRELRWIDGAWVDPSAPAPVPAEPTTAVVTPPPEPTAALATGRPLDADVIGLLSRPVEEKIKDATRGTPYKVNLYSDDRVRWNRAKVDLDRDEKWDEKWTFFPDGAIEREVAPADDDNYTERYVLKDGAWVKKP